ncbi:hypothetical protein Clacol_002791 [Clathrus columnatus]|uniref:Protein aurora borealis n=1 Tax=Clathrus columnatus TaxID=1419009 RepID=A0AAV5A4M1_9AGAM|nr:hypothetical protein Clacol_002791 [Clathrus columnatus]
MEVINHFKPREEEQQPTTRRPEIRVIPSLPADDLSIVFHPERPIPPIRAPQNVYLSHIFDCKSSTETMDEFLRGKSLQSTQNLPKTSVLERLKEELCRRFGISESEHRHKWTPPSPAVPIPTTITSINTSVTSHSPALSLGPSSGFYSLIEGTIPTGSVLQSFLELQTSPLNSGDEIAPIESKYSPGGPLETISEEYEDAHQEDIDTYKYHEYDESLSSSFIPLFHIPSDSQDLRFIFFRPQAEEEQKALQTAWEEFPKLTLDIKHHIEFSEETFHQAAPTESSLSVSSTPTDASFHSTMTSLPLPLRV